MTIRGPPGIGKSTLAQMLCYYIRDNFEVEFLSDGFVYISCFGLETVEQFIKKLTRTLKPEGLTLFGLKFD